MDNVKTDAYYIDRIKKDLQFITFHMIEVDLEETIYETAASLIAVDRNNINIVVEVNYRPDGDANSEIEQDAADSDSVTYVY